MRAFLWLSARLVHLLPDLLVGWHGNISILVTEEKTIFEELLINNFVLLNILDLILVGPLL